MKDIEDDKKIDKISHFIVFVIYVTIILLIENYIIPLISKFEIIIFIRFIEYMMGYSSIRNFSKIFADWKHYNLLHKIVEFPNVIYPLVVKPYLKMFTGLLFFLCVFFGGIYFLIKNIPNYIGINLQFATKAYFALCFSSILLRSFGNKIISSLVKMNYKVDNENEHIELTLSLFNEERIRYAIYFLFLIILMFFSFLSFEEKNIFSYEKIPSAILTSFATFIAFDRLFNNWSLIKFNPKKHWELLVKVYEKDSKYIGNENYLIKRKTKSNE
jgi:hypothetical protein